MTTRGARLLDAIAACGHFRTASRTCRIPRIDLRHRPPNLVSWSVAIALAWLAATADADVYKCAGKHGVPMYQDKPCAAGTALRDFQADPPPLSVLPAPPTPPRTEAATAMQRVPRATASRRSTPRDPARLNRQAQEVDASHRRFLHSGLTDGEVIARIGRPHTVRGAKKSGARWIYLPAPGDPETVTIVSFRDGVVVDVERKISK